MPSIAIKRRDALALLDDRAWERAKAALLDVLASGEPSVSSDSEVWFGLSQALGALGDIPESDKALSRAYELSPKNPAIAVAAAERLLAANDTDKAIKVLQRALIAEPRNVALLKLLAVVFEAAGRHTAALKACQSLAEIDPSNAAPWLIAGGVRMKGQDFAGAEREFRGAVAADPDNPTALHSLAKILRLNGNVAEAREILEKSAKIESDPAAASVLRFTAAFTQPVIPEDEKEIDDSRERFAAALARGPQTRISDPFREGLGPNFFLSYQAKNDLALQKALASYYAEATPSLAQTSPHVGRPIRGRRIKVGILTAYFTNHTVGYLCHGLIKGLDRNRFDVVLLRPTSAPQDKATATFRAAAPLIDLPPDLDAARAAIAAQELDILHYPEIGMDHFTYFIAFARLATLQTVTWGHPVTTGLPNIDLFLSVDAMEPANANHHYSEELVRLTRLTFAAEAPARVVPSRERAGLSPGPAYACLQSLYKVHPRFDDLARKILNEDKDGHLYFISGGPYADNLLSARLSRSLGADAARVKILPRLSQEEFLNFAGAIDVALDVPEWSGGKTSLEAFAMGTPIVHWPGEFMRGRHTLAFYECMALSEAVAKNSMEYVRKALEFVHDAALRTDIRAKIADRQSRLFSDWSSIREIEEVWSTALLLRAS